MKRSSGFVSLLCSAVALLAAGAALAEGRQAPAAVASGTDAQVQQSFDIFAKQWMEKIKHNGAAMPGGARREYADYSIELRPTGQRTAPWVGLLRYTENTVQCSSPGQCATTAAVPVTEIFRFEGGRWVY